MSRWVQLTLLIMSGVGSVTAKAQMAKPYVDGEVIVKLKNQIGTPSAHLFMGKATSQKAMVLKSSWGKMNLMHFALKKGQSVEAAIADLKSDPDVLYAEPNYLLSKATVGGFEQAMAVSDVQSAAFQATSGGYGATSANIGVPTLWSASTSVPTVKPVVAVIDTGLDTTHSVFTDTHVLWTNSNEIAGNGIDDDGNGYIDDVHGWNFVDNSGSIYDDDGHGTHVSGIILSIDQNIYTTPLREAKIRIMPLKFLNGAGVGSTSDAIRAIYYAVNNGASILNNSWGGAAYSAALHEAVAYTYTHGTLFVAASGNSANDNDANPLYPSSYDVPNVIAIAATTDYDYLASFSNFGASSVDIGSPGVYILSTLPSERFGYSSGTSMATPFVSGTAAQMKVESPEMLGYQIRNILLTNFTDVSQLIGKVATNGRLNSSQAVSFAKTAPVQATQPGYVIQYSAERDLASSVDSTAGCGTVSALNGQEPPFASPGAAAVAVVMLLMPVAILLYLRTITPASRRKHDRFMIDSSVRIRVGEKEMVGSVSSISLGGACVNTSALLQDGGVVTMSIESPNGEDRVEVSGRVVWSEANKAYGVAFDQASDSVLGQISDWTKSLKKAS